MTRLTILAASAALLAAVSSASATEYKFSDLISDPTKIVVSGNLIFDQFTFLGLNAPPPENMLVVTNFEPDLPIGVPGKHPAFGFFSFGAIQSINGNDSEVLYSYRVRSLGAPINTASLHSSMTVFGNGSVEIIAATLDNNLILHNYRFGSSSGSPIQSADLTFLPVAQDSFTV